MRGERACVWEGAGAKRGGAENPAPERGRGQGYAKSARAEKRLPAWTDRLTNRSGEAASYLPRASPPQPAFRHLCIGRKARATVANPEFSTPALRHFLYWSEILRHGSELCRKVRKKSLGGAAWGGRMGRARASACVTLWRRHVRGLGQQAGRLPQAVGGVGGKCARACSSAAGESRGAGPRARGRGRAGLSGRGLGGGWRWLLRVPQGL